VFQPAIVVFVQYDRCVCSIRSIVFVQYARALFNTIQLYLFNTIGSDIQPIDVVGYYAIHRSGKLCTSLYIATSTDTDWSDGDIDDRIHSRPKQKTLPTCVEKKNGSRFLLFYFCLGLTRCAFTGSLRPHSSCLFCLFLLAPCLFPAYSCSACSCIPAFTFLHQLPLSALLLLPTGCITTTALFSGCLASCQLGCLAATATAGFLLPAGS
jgi:hypothetical protein